MVKICFAINSLRPLRNSLRTLRLKEFTKNDTMAKFLLFFGFYAITYIRNISCLSEIANC